MGADFIFWAVTMPRNQKPDWNAGIKFIKEEVDTSIDSSGRSITIEELRKELLDKLSNVRDAWLGKRRDVGDWNLSHLRIMITGGMSWGDSPTDLGNDINDLYEAGVLQTCGFDQDFVDYKAILLKVLKTKNIEPLLIGVDKHLDELIDQKLRRK